MADSGQLVCVLAGPASQVERVKPYCKGVMGRATIDFIDQPPSRATLLKIIGNTFILNMVETLAEGHTLAEKSGLGTDNLHQFIEMMFPGPYTAYSNRLTGGDYYKRAQVSLQGIFILIPNRGGVTDEQLAPVWRRFGPKGCEACPRPCKGGRFKDGDCGHCRRPFGRCPASYGLAG